MSNFSNFLPIYGIYVNCDILSSISFLVFIFPLFFVLVPLLLYDAPHLPKNERTCLYCITVLLFFLNGYNFSLSGMLLLIYAFLSLLLSKQQIAYRKLMDSYKKNRDEITEYNLILSKKK